MTYIKLKNKKIAIIGGGIRLICSLFFANRYNVSLYEKSGNLGGHAITLRKKLYDINNKKKNIFFDIGFFSI